MTLFLLAASLAFASGMEPCSTHTSQDGALYYVGQAYQASGLVAIGQVVKGSNLTLKIARRIKGDETRAEVPLTVPHCSGTACWGGFSVAPGIDLLFFLRKNAEGVYDGVTGNGNYSCPTVFEVKGGKALLGKKAVPVASLRKYLEGKPAPIRIRPE